MLRRSAVTFVVLMFFVGMPDLALASDEELAAYSITTKRQDDKVVVRVGRGATVFSVRSPVGISSAVIKRNLDRWPDQIVLHLHLKGLESFGVANGKVELSAAVSSHRTKPRVRVWKGKKEDQPIDSKSRDAMAIRRVEVEVEVDKAASEPPRPTGGYFEVQLPKCIFDENPKSITIRWIDFYRG